MLHKKQKAITQTPTSHPAPLPWGEGCMLHKKQKKLKTYKAKMVSAEMAQSPEIILTAIV